MRNVPLGINCSCCTCTCPGGMAIVISGIPTRIQERCSGGHLIREEQKKASVDGWASMCRRELLISAALFDCVYDFSVLFCLLCGVGFPRNSVSGSMCGGVHMRVNVCVVGS